MLLALSPLPALGTEDGSPTPPAMSPSTAWGSARSPTAGPAATSAGIVDEFAARLGITAADQAFLEPDQAFEVEAEAVDATTVAVRWTMPEASYYLYREKFGFTVREPTGARAGAPRLPDGKIKEDEFFGRMEVYYHQVEALVPIERAGAAPTRLTLDVRYQGCTEQGLCYPPMTRTLRVDLPAAAAGTVQPRADAGTATSASPVAGDLPEQDRIARSLAGGATWLVLATFFGFGLLLTFTPCVLPMIPILSSIIVGQGPQLSTARAFSLSLTYVLAMSATYTAAGVAAGIFGAGANLQAAFQDPWVLSVFIVVFVLLALSMFGFYDLQMPASWQTRLAAVSGSQRGGTHTGVAIMGVASALIVGPCVAAPLAGALIYIGQTGDAVAGGLALFALSLGMGAPVLAVGTSGGRLLPKAGPWMSAVKAVFGVILLGVAIYLLERIVPEAIALLAWAALVLVSAVYLGAFDTLPAGTGGWRRLWKGTGLVMAVYSVLLMVGVAGGGGGLMQPLAGLTATGAGDTGTHRGLAFTRIKSVAGLNGALRTAALENRPVMLDFYADWCISCKELEKFTFSDPGVQAALAGVMLLQADVTANDAEDQALLKELGLFGPPAILFFGPDGRERRNQRVVGYMSAEPFRAHVARALAPARNLAQGVPIQSTAAPAAGE